jgi:hypothetical protein
MKAGKAWNTAKAWYEQNMDDKVWDDHHATTGGSADGTKDPNNADGTKDPNNPNGGSNGSKDDKKTTNWSDSTYEDYNYDGTKTRDATKDRDTTKN